MSIHFHRADVPPVSIAFLWSILSPQERARTRRFRLAHLGRRYVVAHGLTRQLLATHFGALPQHLEFEYTARGKPRIARSVGNRLHFNLSHSGALALIGLARGGELGLDLERCRPDPGLLAIANRFFAPRERAALLALPEARRNEAFYTAWTRKEAYVKAIGRGLSEPLNRCEIPLGREEPVRFARVDGEGNAAAWSLHHLQPFDDVVGALCIRSGGWRISARTLVRQESRFRDARFPSSTASRSLEPVECGKKE
jgi:4'-phosphopantetheinyl transferase